MTPQEGEWQWVTVPWPPLRLEAQEGATRLGHGAPASPLTAGSGTRREQEPRQQHRGHGLVSGMGCRVLDPPHTPSRLVLLVGVSALDVHSGCAGHRWAAIAPCFWGLTAMGPLYQGISPKLGQSPRSRDPRPTPSISPTPYPRCPAPRSGNLASCPRLPPRWCALPPRHV